jgi:hypothetical protein
VRVYTSLSPLMGGGARSASSCIDLLANLIGITMIKFEKIKPGMILYDCRKNRGFGRNKWNTWHVYVRDVDNENRRVLASWNGNADKWISEWEATRYRAKPPSS